jgi:uncharacterized membrane protein
MKHLNPANRHGTVYLVNFSAKKAKTFFSVILCELRNKLQIELSFFLLFFWVFVAYGVCISLIDAHHICWFGMVFFRSILQY